MGRYQSGVTGTTASVASGASLQTTATNGSNFPAYANLVEIVVTSSLNGPFDLRIFEKNTFLDADKLAFWENIQPAVYYPTDNDTGAQANEGFPIPYEDRSAANPSAGSLYFQINNNHSLAQTFTYTFYYEEVPAFTSATGSVAFRQGGVFGTDPGGSDFVRIGGTVRALRLGLGAAADANITFKVQGTNSTGVAIFTTGNTNNNLGVNFENSRGSGWIGVSNSSANVVTGAIDGAFIVAGGPDLTGFGTSLLQLATNGVVRATIDSSGNFGIGTTGPAKKLNVNDASSSSTTIGHSEVIRLGGGNANNSTLSEIGLSYGGSNGDTYAPAIIGYQLTANSGFTKGDIYLATRNVTTDTAPTERFRITAAGAINVATGQVFDASGNLVIASVGPHAIGGATDPGSQWRQQGTFAGSGVGGYLQITHLQPSAGTLSNGFDIEPTFDKAGSGTHAQFAAVYIQPTVTAGAATLTNSDGVFVGTYNGRSTNAFAIRAQAPTGGGTINDVAAFYKSDGSTVVARFLGSGAIFVPNITTSAGLQSGVMCLDSNGQMINDSVACLASSEKFKEHFHPYTESASDILDQIDLWTYNYKAEGIFSGPGHTKLRLGPMAEDMAALRPYLAGYDNSGIPRTVDDRGLISLLIKGWKEQKETIRMLDDRLNTLYGRLNAA